MSLHIEASKNEIAETILLPGDPLRAKYVAENLLDDAKCYNNVRGMYGYTGTYEGKRISIQGTGMGMPTTSIYAHELINDYGVKNLIRVGTCGAIQPEIGLGQVIIAQSGSTDSNMNRITFHGLDYAPTANFDLLHRAHEVAQRLGIAPLVGNVFSSDTFYDSNKNRWDVWASHGVLAVEMETAALYTLAARFGVNALSILTVSDNIITEASTSAQEREQSFMDMMKIALEIG